MSSVLSAHLDMSRPLNGISLPFQRSTPRHLPLTTPMIAYLPSGIERKRCVQRVLLPGIPSWLDQHVKEKSSYLYVSEAFWSGSLRTLLLFEIDRLLGSFRVRMSSFVSKLVAGIHGGA